jgi:ParB-like chromosome segregation protein Spo0J
MIRKHSRPVASGAADEAPGDGLSAAIVSGYQVMPPLSEHELVDLRQSIREHGVLVPIMVDSDGKIVDGHHRAKIAAELGVPCPRQVHDGTPAELRSLAYTLNLDRRHLSREHRCELVKQSLRTDPQLSDREHARRTGVSPTTAGAIRGDLEESVQIEHFSRRTDPRTGKQTQPARKPTPEGEKFLQDHLAGSAELTRLDQARRYRRDLQRSWALQEWDPAFVAEIIEDDDLVTIDHLITNLTNFRDQVQAKQRTKLAAVVGLDGKEYHNPKVRTKLIKASISEAMQRLGKILRTAEGVDFPADEEELIKESLAKLRALIDALGKRGAP